MNRPFNRYARFTAVIKNHTNKAYHKDAVVSSKAFLSSLHNPESANVIVALDKRKKETIRKNRDILKHIVTVIIWIGRQGIAFRGHRESKEDEGNKGNFMEMINLLSTYSGELSNHLTTSKKTTYLSPDIQNQIINIIGNDYIRPKIVAEIKSSKFFSIICDEATSAKKEYMSVVIRFIDGKKDIREEFMGFVPVLRTTGQFLGEKIMEFLTTLGIDIDNCRGQGYDGAASMSSSRCGVQAVIREVNDKAMYFHCASHCLNLVIGHSCSDVSIKTMISKVNEVSLLLLHT